MVYKAIGLMSGSSLDGLDMVFAELTAQGGKWNYEIMAAETEPYDAQWLQALSGAVKLPAFEYLALHAAYGKYLGEAVNRFIDKHHLHHRVQLICSHGHTVFHAPAGGFTAQLGDGAAIAAITGINVISDLRAMDVALGGQGAPIVPMGEKLLWEPYTWLLNLGGIANLTYRTASSTVAFDICPANAVLNMLANKAGMQYDDGGNLAAAGTVHEGLLQQLNALEYYNEKPPKSLDNAFGRQAVFPILESYDLPPQDALCTYCKHVAQQVAQSMKLLSTSAALEPSQMLVTGGGAWNSFLVEQIQSVMQPFNVSAEVPAANIVNYKEALVMALLGVLRWREENTVLSSVTGARRSSIGGAVWIGQEA